MGAYAAAPTTTFEGALYWNSVSDEMFVWNATSWEVISGTGTVTSVQMAGGTTGLTYSGGPITGAGTITTAGTLAAANGGTGLTSPGASGNVLKSDGAGAWTSAADSDSGTVTSIATTGTVNGITLTGGTITTTGTLTLGGALSGVDLTSQITGTLPVANGGTGATALTLNNVILGNGTSAVQVVAPGTSGNLLTSNGSTWTSAAAPASGISAGLSIALAMVMGF